jgi:hypothetical protein
MRTALPLLLALVACRPVAPTDGRQAARLALNSMLAAGRTAHLETSAERLAAGLADTLISIDNGVVTRQPRDSVRAMFDRYFAGARYHAWDDVEPPVVQIAEDNSLAWVARVVCVDREEPAAGGGRTRRTFVSAYSATFVRRSGRWEMTTVTSTFVPTPPPACPAQDALR